MCGTSLIRGQTRVPSAMEAWNLNHWTAREVSRRHLEVRMSTMWGFPGGPVVKNSPASAGDMGSIAGLGRFHMLQGN